MSNYTSLFNVFWLCICTCACFGLAFMIHSISDSFKNEPIAFLMDTDNYMNWNTSWPAIILCEKRNFVRVNNFVKSQYNTTENRYVSTLHELTFSVDSMYQITKCINEEKSTGHPCFLNNMNIHETVINLRNHSEDIFHKCFWNNKEFSCKLFQPVSAFEGLCFALNSLHTGLISIDLISNEKIGPGQLIIQVKSSVYIHVLSPAEIPIEETPLTTEIGKNVILQFSVIEMLNDNIRDLTPIERRCQFHDEQLDHPSYYKLYSPSVCKMNEYLNSQIKYCNCSTYRIEHDLESSICNLTGIRCLDTYKGNILREMNDVICPYDCEELTINIVSHKKFNLEDDEETYGQLILNMQQLPTLKYRRMRVRDNLDFVVAFGGAASFIFGASLLSLVELFYLILFRPIGNLLQKK